MKHSLALKQCLIASSLILLLILAAPLTMADTTPAKPNGLCAELADKFNTTWNSWRSHSTMLKTLDYLNSKYPGAIVSPSNDTIKKWLSTDKNNGSASSSKKSLYVTCHNTNKTKVTLSIRSSISKKRYSVVLNAAQLLK